MGHRGVSIDTPRVDAPFASKDEQILGESGILLDGYTLQPAQDGGLPSREYARNGITDLNAAIQEVKVAGEIDARGRRP
jgi:hypothetical protein